MFRIHSILILLVLFICTSCATKYVLPGNRFLSPESAGGSLRPQVEIQQNGSKLVTVDVTGGRNDNRLQYTDKTRTGFFFGMSLVEQLDFIWYQTASSVGFIGGRFQLYGGSKASKAVGHKLAITAAFGGNEHELDSSDPKVKFTMGGQDYSIIHGYRFTENIMIFESISRTRITYDGSLKSGDPTFNGLQVGYRNILYGLFGGLEFNYNAFTAKLECGYQIIESTHTRNKEGILFGYALGYSF